jgi:heat-inducible transcriptional repressor
MLRIVDIFDDKNLLKSVLAQAIAEGVVQVIIGEENTQESLRNFSLVLTRYGIVGEATGILGVVGPTRMQYGRSVSSVRYLGTVMSELVEGLRRGEHSEKELP